MTAYPKDTIPRVMDVVWCRFPFDERPAVPAIVCHPGLVFGVNEFRPGEFAIQVSYGTSSLKTDTRVLDHVVMNAVNLCHAGLAQATRFDLDRIRWLPWTEDWFQIQDQSRHTSPVIGRLPVSEIEDLRQKMRVRQKAGKLTP